MNLTYTIGLTPAAGMMAPGRFSEDEEEAEPQAAPSTNVPLERAQRLVVHPAQCESSATTSGLDVVTTGLGLMAFAAVSGHVTPRSRFWFVVRDQYPRWH